MAHNRNRDVSVTDHYQVEFDFVHRSDPVRWKYLGSSAREARITQRRSKPADISTFFHFISFCTWMWKIYVKFYQNSFFAHAVHGEQIEYLCEIS